MLKTRTGDTPPQASHERLESEDASLEQGPTDRSFGVTFAVVFALLGAWLFYKDTPYWMLSGGLALAFLAVALARPSLLGVLNRLWAKLGHVLHKVVSPLVLGALFFGVITPFGLLRRTIGQDPMQRRYDKGARSYWIEREPGPAPDTMRNQF